jgi:C_GCAxxG_C_C family probable redox protein
MNRIEQAVGFHQAGFNCSQAVAMTFSPEMNLSREQVARLASALGAGVGQMRETCGAVTGAALVLGSVEGWGNDPTPERKQILYDRMRALGERFEAQQGSLQCGKLLGMPDRTAPMPPPEDRPCNRLIAAAVNLLEEALDANHQHP